MSLIEPVRPALPLATYFMNAGLSEGDAIDVEIAVLARARQLLTQKARMDDAGARFRYLNDAQHRIKVNQQIIADTLSEFGFSRCELLEIDRGMQLGLVQEGPQPTRARVLEANGRKRSFLVEDLEDLGPEGRKLVRLTDDETGEKLIG